MHASNQRWRALDVRSWHVAAALIALVIIVALGSALGKVGLLPAAPTAQFGQVPGEGMLMADESLVEAPAADGQGALEMRLSAADDAGAKAADAIGRVDDALIVRTASLELEVEDVAAVLGVARREMAALGGYVSGSDEYDQGEHRWASVTYRVPVDRFDAAIEALRGLSDRVVRESTQASEVTATVVDLDARIARAAIPGVLESAVIGLPHPDFGESVTAVVVARSGVLLVETQLIEQVKALLANYKVPKRVILVPDLPRNAMGKVQKNVLRQRYGA